MPLEIHGAKETMAALKSFDPEAAKRIQKALTAAATELRNTAKSMVDPDGLSGWTTWRGGYDPSTISRGIRIKRGGRVRKGLNTKNFIGVVNSTPTGAIWEVAGRKSRGKDNRGAAFIRNIEARGGQASRTVWAAADQTDMAGAEAKVWEAISEARAIVQAHIASAS